MKGTNSHGNILNSEIHIKIFHFLFKRMLRSSLEKTAPCTVASLEYESYEYVSLFMLY